MPIYEYEAKVPAKGCPECSAGFEFFHRTSSVLTACPACGAEVVKVVSRPSVGGSTSGLDDRAKSAGFHKLKRLGKGEYEKQY